MRRQSGWVQPLVLSPRRVLLGALLLTICLLLGVRFVLSRGPAPAEPAAAPVVVRAAPSRTPKLIVHVVGAVHRPGLFRLREGARVADAVARAGGVTARAELALLNLAAPLGDGQQVVVPARTAVPAGGTAPAPVAGAGAAPAGPVQLSTATAEQLDSLPGVGPATAAKILAYRDAHGPFRSVDGLDGVPGIGPGRLEQLRDLVVP
jgi:competence protein ComEA